MASSQLTFTAAIFRIVLVFAIVSIPITWAVFYVTGRVSNRYMQLFGKNEMEATRAIYSVSEGYLFFQYFTGWDGTHPHDGEMFSMRGVIVSWTIVASPGATHGDAILSITVTWWAVLIANLLSLLAACFIARPLFRRRTAPGHCPKCGYDLRASPTRCPECGSAITSEAPAAD
jgi:hypothetical protein